MYKTIDWSDFMASKYGFIVDTNSYSGNFERPMCAFMTGHTGACGVGRSERELFLENFTPVSGVIRKPDENGTQRPVEIYTTPDIWNNGLGFHFRDGEEEKALEEYKNYFVRYKEDHMKRVESYRGKNIHSWTDETIDREIKRYRTEIAEILLETSVKKYPAYQSIIIHFNSLPSNDTIDFLKKRAYEYTKYCNNVTITGFRILDDNKIKSI